MLVETDGEVLRIQPEGPIDQHALAGKGVAGAAQVDVELAGDDADRIDVGDDEVEIAGHDLAGGDDGGARRCGLDTDIGEADVGAAYRPLDVGAAQTQRSTLTVGPAIPINPVVA